MNIFIWLYNRQVFITDRLNFEQYLKKIKFRWNVQITQDFGLFKDGLDKIYC